MPTQLARRLTLIDAMILVGAAALGFAGIRAELTTHLHPVVQYIEEPFVPPTLGPVGAGGMTIAVTSVSVAGPISGPNAYFTWFWTTQKWSETTRLAAPCLSALSLAMLSIRLRRPRPSWRRLVRQAGTVASLGATLALGVRLIYALLKLLLESFSPTMVMPSNGPPPSRLSWIACQTTQPHLIGVVVLSSWLVLAMGGRRRERGWIDRGGIAVGLGWIALLMFHLFRNEPA